MIKMLLGKDFIAHLSKNTAQQWIKQLGELLKNRELNGG
jgi:hypothetical protein